MIKDLVLKSFTGRSVLVTGGTGMIGRQIVNILCDAGAAVRVVSLDRLKVDSRAEHLHADLTDLDTCMSVTRDTEFVFHIAGVAGSVKFSKQMPASHFVPTLMFNVNMLHAARLNKVRRLVYTSSIGAYASNSDLFVEGEPGTFSDAPMDFAGWAKRMAELQTHAYKVQYGIDTFSVVRPAHVYGPGDNFDPENALVIGSLMHRIASKQNPVVVWGDGSAVRDFVFVRDVAHGCILALHHGTNGRYVNLGAGRGYSIRELVEALSQFLDFKYEFDATKPGGYPKRVMDITLARKLIDYQPSTTLVEGLKETWEWYLQHRDEYQLKKDYFQDDAKQASH